MNKENVQLTDEQRARIDRNFRAAKALLDRKRRSDTANSSGCYPHKIDTVNRKPLSDISSNTSTSVIRSVNGLPFSGISSNTSTSVKRSVNGVPLSGISSNTSTTFRISKTDNVYRNDSFQTPIRQINCSGKSCVTEKPNKNKVSLDSFKTPIRPFDCNVSFGVEKKELGDYGSGDGGLSYSVTPMRHESCWSSNESSTTMGTVFYEECFLAEIDQICESVKKPKLIAKESSCDIALKSVDAKTKSSELRTDVSPVAMQNLQSESDIALKSVDAKTKSSELITDVSPQNLQSENDIALKSVDAKTNSSELRTDVSPVAMQNLQSENDISLDAKTNSSELRTDVSPVAMQILQSESDSETLKIGGMPEEYEKYMNSLNDRQREAACSDISIPLMIVAGPGSGKTSTMVGRVLMLLHKGIEASNVLAMTFTTAAASEMRDRIGAVAGKAVAKALMINTFHSFSLQLCRLHAEKLNRTTDFLVYGQGQQRKAVIEALRVIESEKNLQISDSGQLCDESNVAKKGPEDFKDKSKKWLKFVAQAKASGKTFEECERSGNLIGAAILRKYEDILHKCNSLDYHDLISCSVKLLTDFPEVFKECQESWQAMVIDEFQDTSAMQYVLLRTLASHQRITIVGDEDQSIFSFNGADVSGFKSFRRDFQPHKEIRLNKNYRSTRCIVDAASFLIRNNSKRTQMNKVLTDNSSGSKIIVKECCNEAAQCLFVADKILELTSSGSSVKGTFGEIAVLYRRQVSGKVFQTAFRDRKIPFNVHGVAFYRKKVVRAIISMLRTTLVSCDDGSFRRVFKALLPLEKEEKKRIIDHINKVSTVRKCSFISAASDIFSAKISGTFKRCQLTLGRKVLVTLDIISKLAHREQSISAVITAVANMIPQKYLLEQRAVLDADGGKLLNEEHDLRSVLQYLLDDVSEFLKSYNFDMDENVIGTEEKGCVNVLTEFLDFISERETENFRVRRHDNDHAVTLTTIHQSKGLEWDTVFIVKANENEIPLLHEYNGITKNTSASIEEERRLLYVAVTRARKKLFILYVTLDSNWQVLQPSRFLQEFPKHLLEIQDELSSVYMQGKYQECSNTKSCLIEDPQAIKTETNEIIDKICNEDSKESNETMVPFNGNDFLKRFSSEERSTVSILFNHWAKKAAFKEPKRLLDKVAFVIDERLRVKKTAQKDVLRSLKSCLKSNEAFQYAENVLKWLQIPADKRAYITREKQEHFQKLRIEKSMGSSEPTTKQIAYLQSLGCTTIPTSRLHASTLIEQYKKL